MLAHVELAMDSRIALRALPVPLLPCALELSELRPFGEDLIFPLLATHLVALN